MAKINIRLHELLKIMRENDEDFFREDDAQLPRHPLIPGMGCEAQSPDPKGTGGAALPPQQKQLLKPGGLNENEILDILGARGTIPSNPPSPPPAC